MSAAGAALRVVHEPAQTLEVAGGLQRRGLGEERRDTTGWLRERPLPCGGWKTADVNVSLNDDPFDAWDDSADVAVKTGQ